MAEAFGHNNSEDNQTHRIAQEFEDKFRKNEFIFLDMGRVNRIFEFYAEAQEWRKAKALIEFALETYPNNGELYFKKAYLYFEMSRFSMAERAIEHSLVLSPFTYEYLSLKSDILARLGKYEEAIENLKVCFAFATRVDEIYLQMGNVAQICRRPKESESYYREALHRNNSFEEAVVELAYLFESEDKIEGAISLCKEYLDEHPYAYKIWFIQAKLHQKVHQLEEALEAYDFVIVIKEDFEQAYVKKGELLMEMGNYEEGLRSLLSANALQQSNIHTLYHIGECFEQLESFTDAFKYFTKVTKQDPDYFDAWVGMGFCLERRDKFLEAIHYYQKAFNIDEENADLCLSLAVCEYKLGQRYNAYLYLEKAIGLTPNEASLWLDWAQVLFDHDNHVGAVTYLEEGIKLNPQIASLYYYCAAYCYKAGYKDKAFTYLENALLLDFKEHSLLFDLIPELKEVSELMELIESYK
ncbi:MAG: tetratricopeptide repeat protein [Bacteroidota bacterium]